LVGSQDRPVVGYELGEQAEDEQHHEDPEGPVATSVRLEVLQTAAIGRGQPISPWRRRVSRRGQGDRMRHQTSLRSKSIRGSIQASMRSEIRLTTRTISEKM